MEIRFTTQEGTVLLFSDDANEPDKEWWNLIILLPQGGGLTQRYRVRKADIKRLARTS